jgi:hypothetical protein
MPVICVIIKTEKNETINFMKTKNVVLTMVAVMVASAFTFAAPASRVAVLNQNNSGVYKVIYEGATAGKVTLKIYDNSSNVIFSETKKGLSKFMLPLNFTGSASIKTSCRARRWFCMTSVLI